MPPSLSDLKSQFKKNREGQVSALQGFQSRFQTQPKTTIPKVDTSGFDFNAPRMSVAPAPTPIAQKTQAADSTALNRTQATPTPQPVQAPAPATETPPTTFTKPTLTPGRTPAQIAQATGQQTPAQQQTSALRQAFLGTLAPGAQEAGLAGQLGQISAGLATGQAGIEAGAAPRGITTPFVTGRQAALRRQTATEALPIQAQLAALQAQRQGQQTLAEAELGFAEEDITTAETAQIEQQAQQLQSGIASLVSQGITDPTEVFQQLQAAGINANFDDISAALGQAVVAPEDISTQIVEAGGNKVLINSQTGETIRVIGPTGTTTKADETAATEAFQKEGEVDTLQTKVDLIDGIRTHAGLNSRVGPNVFARRAFALADRFGAGQDFAGSVQQLTNQEFIDKLISAKAQGATFGALNQSEADSLRNAATKINAWEVKGDDGIGTGEWNIDEASFIAELDKIKTLANKAISRAGGTPETEIDIASIEEFIT